jgi:hypothetical protein
MARKSDKGAKAARGGSGKTGRWTVRGVPVRLQRAAANAARAEGKTVGQWLTQLLAAETARAGVPSAPVEGWGETIERRLERLEQALFGEGTPAEAARSGQETAVRPAA